MTNFVVRKLARRNNVVVDANAFSIHKSPDAISQ